jgi:peptidyl-prolyl cis-trans isomerase SurA
MKHTIACALLMILAIPASAADRTFVEGIVVRVNDRILTTADFRQRISERSTEAGKPVPVAAYPDLIQEAADELCMLERVAELKLEISNEELNAAIQQVRETNHVPDDAAFEQTLKGMGMTVDSLRARLRDTILIQKLLRRELGDLPLTEEELRERYQNDKAQFMIGERVHLEHYLLTVAADRSDLEAKLASVRRLVAAARAGGDFLTLVQEEVKRERGTGGDLGIVLVADLRPEFREVVDKLKPGEVSDPFVTSNGVHAGRLVQRIPPTLKPFEEVQDELRRKEMDERYRAHLASVVTELKKRYLVETHPDLLGPAK